MNNLCYVELDLPELVNDIRNMYDTIVSLTSTKYRSRGWHLPTILISDYNPRHKGLLKIIDKYPFFDKEIALFFNRPNAPYDRNNIHLDGPNNRNGRKSCINIPIKGCNENGVTKFFDIKEEFMLSDGSVRYVIPEYIIPEPIAEYRLIDKPILVNTQIPHVVDNSLNPEPRSLVSWKINRNWSWSEAVSNITGRRPLDVL